ncbi:MAG TPA: T9SS type A sorting domain-containing protein, partial [Bacteroidales bacterium]|nr:T9SS type A sorting domain-containing protein [Bacteroidales bacterium]
RGEEVSEVGFFAWGSPIISGMFFNANHHIYVPFPGIQNALLAGTDRGIFYVTLEEGSGTVANLNRIYNTLQCYSLAVGGGLGRLIGTQGNGVVFISGKGNTVDRGERILTGFNGAAAAMSIINHDFLVYAGPSAATGAIPIFRSPDFGITEATTPFIPWVDPTAVSLVPIFNNTGVFLTPQLHWESFNFEQHSRDSVNFIAIDTSYQAGNEVWVRSALSRYPFRYTLPEAMQSGDTIRVKDPIASRFFMAVRGGVWMTKEAINFVEPPEWFRIAILPISPAPAPIPSSIAISSDGNTLWVGARRGQLYRITNINNAYNFATATAGNPACVIVSGLVTTFTGRFITSISVDPSNPNHIIVTLGNYGNDVYVYRSTNAMAATPDFVSVQGNLPLMPIYSSLIEMNNTNLVFLGTDRGVFATNTIANPNWQPVDDGMGIAPVTVLLQQTHNRPTIAIPIDDFGNYDTYPGTINYGKIYAATFGRGTFFSDMYVGIPSLPDQDRKAKGHLHIFPNPAKEIVTARFDLARSAKTELSVLDLSGRVVRNSNQVMLNAGSHQLPMDISGLTSGVYIIRLQAGDQVLTNKLIVR